MSEWEDRRDWLAELQTGDEVVIRSHYGQNVRIRTIERTTKTLFIADNLRFNRETGRTSGRSYDRASLDIPTQELKHALEIGEAVYMLRHQTDWRHMPEDVVVACANIVRTARAKVK